MRPVYLQAVAIADHEVFAGPRGIERWNLDGRDAPPDPRRFHPGQPRLGRLDLPSRYVVCAAGMLPSLPPDRAAATAVILGSTAGSLDADLAFAASVAERPSPATYARTLPSTPGAELAILMGYRGANFAIIQDGSPGLLALAAAVQEIAAGACEAAVAGEFDAVSGPGGPGAAVLCLLAAEPSQDGRSREITATREGAGEGGRVVDLRALYTAFLDSPAPFSMAATGSGSRLRLDCGPATTR